MSDKDATDKVFEVIRDGGDKPMSPEQVFVRIDTVRSSISKTQARRALMELAAQRRIRITPDRKLELVKG